MKLKKQKEYSFLFDSNACEKCQAICCRGESGKIWVNLVEIENISKFLSLNQIDFMDTYLYQVDNRYSIKERFKSDNYECVFLGEDKQQNCSIYAVRPQQCRSFPFWDYYKQYNNQLLLECPGISKLPTE